MNQSRESEAEGIEQAIKKSNDNTLMRVKTCEVYCKDKLRDMRESMKSLESRSDKYALKSQIDKITENEKMMKQNF